MKNRTCKTVALASLVAVLSACGGGGGDSDNGVDVDAGSDVAADGGITVDDDVVVDDVVGNDDVVVDDVVGNDDVVVDDVVGNDDGDVDDVVGNDDDDVLDSNAVEITAVYALGGSAVDVPTSTLLRVNGYSFNRGGDVAYFGSYTSGNSTFDGVWSGTPDDMNLLLSTGSAIVGLPNNEKYDSTQSLSLASNGDLAQVVKLTGAVQNNVLVISADGDSEVLLETGDKLDGFAEKLTVETLEAVSHSPTATAFVSKTDSSYYTHALWLYQNGQFKVIAETFDSSVDSAPALVKDECRVFLKSNGSSVLPTYPTLLDNGALVFTANLRNYASGPCVEGTALLSYQNGNYSTLVAEGDAVPNASNSKFTNIELIKVTADGTSLVYADLETPTGVSYQPNVQSSYWTVSLDGSKRLVSLEGEEVEVGQTNELITRPSSGSHIDYSDSDYVGMLVNFNDTNKATLLGGKAHTGQPYPVLTTPGATSLDYLIDRTASLPEPFADTEFFSTLGKPAVLENGSLVFYGEVSSSTLETVTTKAIWQIDIAGTITKLVTEEDTLTIGGVDRALVNLVQDYLYQRRGADSVSILANTDGGFYFRANLESTYGSDVLVYVPPVL